MFCCNCGTNLPDGTAFCDQCGIVQNETQPVPTTSAPNLQEISVSMTPPKKKNKGFLIAIIVVLVIALAGIGFAAQKIFQNQGYGSSDSSSQTQSKEESSVPSPSTPASSISSAPQEGEETLAESVTSFPPQQENGVYAPPLLENNLIYYADISLENYGTITVQLNQSAAPVTAANFVYLANSGFYNGLTFHRIIEGFMMQGGDPNGNGTGGSQNCIPGEFAANGFYNPLSHTRGVISMARSGDPNSASSQFFIMHKAAPHLDGQYAAFGQVTQGMEIVDTICATAQPVDNNGTIPSQNQPKIISVTIRNS